MSRGLTSGFQSHLEGEALHVAYFVQLEFDAGNFNLWTGDGDFVFDVFGVPETFLGVGALGSIGNIDQSSRLSTKGVALGIIGQGNTIYQMVQAEQYRGRSVHIWAAFMNEAFDTVQYSYLLNTYLMDQVSITDVFGTGESAGQKLTLTTVDELTDLFRASSVYYSNADQQALYPGDTFFRLIATLAGREMLWGAKSWRPLGNDMGPIGNPFPGGNPIGIIDLPSGLLPGIIDLPTPKPPTDPTIKK